MLGRSKDIEIGMALLYQEGSYLLQKRNIDPMIGAAGLIGCFGGKLNFKETFAMATARELSEETNIVVSPRHLTAMGKVNVESDMNGKTVHIHARVYSYDVPASLTVVAKEGTVVGMTLEDMRSALALLTPATRACVEQLMEPRGA